MYVCTIHERSYQANDDEGLQTVVVKSFMKGVTDSDLLGRGCTIYL